MYAVSGAGLLLTGLFQPWLAAVSAAAVGLVGLHAHEALGKGVRPMQPMASLPRKRKRRHYY